MRNKFLLQPMLWAMMIVLFSCQKDPIKNNSNDLLISKVNTWLDKQKSTKQPNKAANIDLLKENIDFSVLKFEDLNTNEQFIVIPIKESYKIKKNIDKNTHPVLLLVQDKTGNILRGNIVLYIPENNQQMNHIPDNTFSKMYAEKDLECSGLFRFLSPTGRWMHQREYKSKKLHSFGYVKADNSQARTSTECTHYVLNLYLWYDGVLIAQETVYLGFVCQSDCDNSENQTLCPDDDNGGGGGGSGQGEQTCCIPDPNAQITFEYGDEKDWHCLPETIDQTTGRLTKSCTHTWSFHHNRLLWYTWDFVATTGAKFEKIGDNWIFIETATTPSFQGITTDGQLPPCISSKCINVSPTITVAGNKAWAALGISYTVETKVYCFSWATPSYDPSTVQATLNPPS